MLSIGNYYRLFLTNPRTDQYDVQIIGITNITEKNYFLNFDIQGSFFTSYNLGLSSYLSAVANDAPIYICLRVTNRSPLKLESNPSLLVPANIVDEASTISLLSSNDYTFNVTGLTLSLPPLQLQSYLNAAMADITIAMQNVIEMAGYNLSVSYTQTNSIYEESYINSLLENNLIAQQGQAEMNLQSRQNYEFKTNLLSEKILELNAKINQYNNSIDSLNLILNQLASRQSSLNSQLTNVSSIEEYLSSIIAYIQKASPSLNIPDFSTLYNDAANGIAFPPIP